MPTGESTKGCGPFSHLYAALEGAPPDACFRVMAAFHNLQAVARMSCWILEAFSEAILESFRSFDGSEQRSAAQIARHHGVASDLWWESTRFSEQAEASLHIM